ncbi:hypothetical protein FAZ98_23075 [Paraburkholderia acidisoli]|uniref:Uncharacterized protein n=2 Tax=Paraburkholderia acidisoli TaxID=2571748 RepID=A0A7Z2GPX1_9BURK|nr:hypothetical protein FAZ98_23075 [Paraburkholderia acidisoli]
MIADLSVAQELDRREMSAVHGGNLGLLPVFVPAPKVNMTSTSFTAEQVIGQTNDIVNNTGNDVALVTGICSTVNPKQTANNAINYY